MFYLTQTRPKATASDRPTEKPGRIPTLRPSKLGNLITMVLEGSERELVEACRRGEREAFRALFEIYRDRVYSIALRYSGDETAAMDIAQDTFLKLFASIHQFRGDAAFQTWIYRLVVNSCFDHKRRTRRLVPLAAGFLATLRASADSLADLLRSEVRTSVRTAVDRLSPALRMVIVLRYTEALSYEEIAAVLGCSQGTVASRLNRAHKALGRRLSHLANGGNRHV
jgi:RNA polymerase sigma-70 factor (ECF subfamily)